jgi:hypothetical protein
MHALESLLTYTGSTIIIPWAFLLDRWNLYEEALGRIYLVGC